MRAGRPNNTIHDDPHLLDEDQIAETTEVIAGAVIGPATQPDAAGLNRGGHLMMVGRTVMPGSR